MGCYLPRPGAEPRGIRRLRFSRKSQQAWKGIFNLCTGSGLRVWGLGPRGMTVGSGRPEVFAPEIPIKHTMHGRPWFASSL